MRHYHPVRAELVERLEAVRRTHAKAELQKQMLGLLTAKTIAVPDLAKDQTYKRQQLVNEGFDEESQAEWRRIVLADIRTSRDFFKERGRNIFDMSLVAPMFINVDVDDVILEDTPLPFEALYIHLGTGAELSFNAERFVEGVYVRDNAGSNCIHVTFVCNQPDFENTDLLPLGLTYKRFTTAVTTHLLRDAPISQSLASVGYFGDPDMMSVRSVMTSAMRMTVNGLLYLNLPRADIEFSYDRNAPGFLVKAATRENVPKGAKARRKLEEDGYIQVNFVGRNTIPTHVAGDSGVAPSGTRAVHWRRGHWRRVAVGAGRSGREWRLIEPTIVNKALGSPSHGRVHIVRPSPAGQTD